MPSLFCETTEYDKNGNDTLHEYIKYTPNNHIPVNEISDLSRNSPMNCSVESVGLMEPSMQVIDTLASKFPVIK